MKKFKGVFSGGGTRGAVLVGALEFFREQGWEPEEALGVSMGSIVAAGVASGRDPKTLLELVKKFAPVTPLLDKRLLFFWPFAKGAAGPIKGNKILKVFREFLPKDYDHTTVPLHIRTHNWQKRWGVVWTEGDLALHVRASMSLPIFDMVKLDGEWHEDGGVSGNFPLDYDGWKLDTDAPVVGFSFAYDKPPRDPPANKVERILGTIDDSLAATDREMMEQAKHMAEHGDAVHHVVLETTHGGLEFNLTPKDCDEMFDEGYESARRWWSDHGL